MQPGPLRFSRMRINTAPVITVKRLSLLLLFVLLTLAPAVPTRAANATPEFVLLVGGPSLMKWEKYKGPLAHDHWWANFVRAARIRTEQLREKVAAFANRAHHIH